MPINSDKSCVLQKALLNKYVQLGGTAFGGYLLGHKLLLPWLIRRSANRPSTVEPDENQDESTQTLSEPSILEDGAFLRTIIVTLIISIVALLICASVHQFLLQSNQAAGEGGGEDGDTDYDSPQRDSKGKTKKGNQSKNQKKKRGNKTALAIPACHHDGLRIFGDVAVPPPPQPPPLPPPRSLKRSFPNETTPKSRLNSSAVNTPTTSSASSSLALNHPAAAITRRSKTKSALQPSKSGHRSKVADNGQRKSFKTGHEQYPNSATLSGVFNASPGKKNKKVPSSAKSKSKRKLQQPPPSTEKSESAKEDDYLP